jgi:hypothetical protein
MRRKAAAAVQQMANLAVQSVLVRKREAIHEVRLVLIVGLHQARNHRSPAAKVVRRHVLQTTMIDSMLSIGGLLVTF